MAKKNFKETGDQIISLVGGLGNISLLTHCVTRLRFKLKDEGMAKTEEIKALPGVISVVRASGQYQVVIGNDVVNVFDEIISNYKINTGEALTVNEDEPDEKNGAKKYWGKFLDYITGTMTQTLPILIGSGLISVILALAVNLFGVSTENPTYQVFNYVYNAGFYFLPVYVGFAAAKKLNSNPFLAAFMGAVLIHPTYTNMVTEGTTELFGVAFKGITYSSSVIPMLLITFVLSYVEKYLYKKLPSAIKSTFAPLLTILIMVPISLFILGPIGFTIGSAIVSAILWVYATVPMIIVPLTALAWPLLVMVGAHTLLVPTMTELVAASGFDGVVKPGAYCSNFAILGVCLGVALKSKKNRAVAISAATSALFGITEPAIYGVILPLKKTMISMMGGAAIGGLVAGICGVKAFTFAANSIFSIVIFGETMIFAIIAIIVACVGGFAITMLWKFDE